MGEVGAPELLIILVVVLVLFGGAKLPELARSLGKAKKEFQKGIDEGMSGSHAHGVDERARTSGSPDPAPVIEVTPTVADHEAPGTPPAAT